MCKIVEGKFFTFELSNITRINDRISFQDMVNNFDYFSCWSYVGKIGIPKQTVSLGIPGCVHKGIAIHEFMHALGFQHEQSRSDRDDYVRVLRDNLEGGKYQNICAF